MGTIATGQRNKYFLKFSETPGAYYLVSSQAYTKRNTPLALHNRFRILRLSTSYIVLYYAG